MSVDVERLLRRLTGLNDVYETVDSLSGVPAKVNQIQREVSQLVGRKRSEDSAIEPVIIGHDHKAQDGNGVGQESSAGKVANWVHNVL